MVFSVGRDSFKAECRIPKEYSDGDISADNSLCFLEREVKGIEFESLDITDSVSTGDQVLLSGFGCTKKGGPTDGIFRIGEAIVSTKSTRMGDGYFVTRKPVANLCPGDSGGPCWSMKDGKRVSVIGNNSRSDLENYSYIASTSAKSFVRFLAAWKKIHPEARICGVDLDAKGCRGAKTPTKPQTEFELDHEVAWVGVIMKPQYVPVLEKFRRIVEAALGSLVPSR
jgi:hypothetical protein